MTPSRFATAAALSLLAVAPAAAQRGGFGGGQPATAAYPDPPALSFPTDDPIIKQIWTMGEDNSHVKTLSQVLFDSLGPRLMGSPFTKGAQDWLVKTYKSWGIDAKEEQ